MRRRGIANGFAALALTLGAIGCGPIEYLSQVSGRAAGAVAAARAVEAPKHAPYEYTAAEAYLHQARAEAAHSNYQLAIDYGRKAEALAVKARTLTVEKAPRPEAKPAP